MKRAMFVLIALTVLTVFVGNSAAEQDLIKTVADGCKVELEKYCGQVTPGQGRVLACLYAHGDKLSGQCEYALYDAAVQLERAVAALSYLANECDADCPHSRSGARQSIGPDLETVAAESAELPGDYG